MIKNKKLFYIAFIPFITSLIINFPFPHTYPFGREMASILTIPVVTANGLNFIGIFSLILLLISLPLFYFSLDKYNVRFLLIAFLFSTFFPSFLVDIYQQTLAKGIYAVSYNEEESECNFNRIDTDMLQVECKLPFENYSHEDVTFFIDFYENYPFEDEVKMLSLLRQNGPYKVTIRGDSWEKAEIKTKIDVSNIESYVESGTATYVNIVLKQGDHVRKL